MLIHPRIKLILLGWLILLNHPVPLFSGKSDSDFFTENNIFTCFLNLYWTILETWTSSFKLCNFLNFQFQYFLITPLILPSSSYFLSWTYLFQTFQTIFANFFHLNMIICSSFISIIFFSKLKEPFFFFVQAIYKKKWNIKKGYFTFIKLVTFKKEYSSLLIHQSQLIFHFWNVSRGFVKVSIVWSCDHCLLTWNVIQIWNFFVGTYYESWYQYCSQMNPPNSSVVTLKKDSVM